MQGFRVRQATWQADRAALCRVREAVFVVEQGVPPALEWDEADAMCWHVLAESGGGEAIGAGRLLRDGHIGRLAVERPWRGRGVGGALLLELVGLAQAEGMPQLILHAQTHAIGFYVRHGFIAQGPDFVEAGIPHRLMRRSLLSRSRAG